MWAAISIYVLDYFHLCGRLFQSMWCAISTLHKNLFNNKPTHDYLAMVFEFLRKNELISELKSNLEEDLSSSTLVAVYSRPLEEYLSYTWPMPLEGPEARMDKLWKLMEKANKEYGFTSKDVWALLYANKIFALTNACSSFVVGTMFRRQLKMRHTSAGSFSTFMPAIIGSVAAGMALHVHMVQSQMPLDPERSSPPMRLLFNSTAYHVGTSVAYNLLFTSFSSIYYANRHSTFPIPSDYLLTAESRSYVHREIIRPVITKNAVRLGLLIGFQGLLAAGITFMEWTQMKHLFHAHVDHFRQVD